MPIADIYVLDHVQTFNNEPIHNIYTFESLDTGSAVDLINAFQSDILPSVQALQVPQIITATLKAYSLGNLGDLSEETINTPGTYDAGQMLPVFNAINFSLKPASRAVRSGSKRIAGINEAVQVDGVVTEAAYITRMETLRTAYGQNISTDDENFYQIVVVKRVIYEVPGSDPVRMAYRYPETDLELVSVPLRNVTTTTKISHQVSRGN